MTPQTATSTRQQGTSRGRRIAFRIWSVVTSLWFLALFGIGALELFFMWLPDQTILSMFDEPADLPVHRTHFLIVGIVSWAFLLSTFAQLRKPERRVAPMLQLLVMTLGAALVYAYSGTFAEWLSQESIVVLPVLVLALLHPRVRDLLARPEFDRAMTLLAAVAAIPWMAFIVDNSRVQLMNAVGDTHAEMEHWATAALLGITMLTCAFIGSSSHVGWRLPAWIAVGGSVLFGVHSLVFPGLSSGLAPFWAVALVLWGVAFAATILQRGRGDAAASAS